jgi:hypothetical protein
MKLSEEYINFMTRSHFYFSFGHHLNPSTNIIMDKISSQNKPQKNLSIMAEILEFNVMFLNIYDLLKVSSLNNGQRKMNKFESRKKDTCLKKKKY